MTAASNGTNGTRSPDAILADIQAIRSEMDSTLLAIEERLTPGQMVDQGLDYLRNSGGREFLTNLGTSVKTHPMPATLVGIGLAWLMVTQQRDNRPGRTGRVDYDRAGIRTAPGESLSDTESSLREKAGEKMGDVKAKVGDMAGRASDAMASARDRVSDSVNAVRDRAASTAQRARDAYATTSDMARMQMDRARTGYRQLMQEQPLALGAIGLGIGALLAALAPRTQQEDQLMGDAADAVKHRAVQAGHEQLSRAGERVRSTLDDAAGNVAARGSSAPEQERADPAARGTTAATGATPSALTSPPLTGDTKARSMQPGASATGSTRASGAVSGPGGNTRLDE